MHNRDKGGALVRTILLFAVITLALNLGIMPVTAMINPAAGYCTALGYRYADTIGPDGSMTGICILPDNRSVDAWKFLGGEVAQDQSYCKKQGYGIKTVNEPVTCKIFLTDSCAVCILPDGSSTEVTKLMNLDFREKICNDRICCDPRSDTTCVIGSEIPAGREEKEIPGTFPISGIYLIGLLLIVIIGIAGVAFLVMKRRKGIPVEKKE